MFCLLSDILGRSYFLGGTCRLLVGGGMLCNHDGTTPEDPACVALMERIEPDGVRTISLSRRLSVGQSQSSQMSMVSPS